MERKQPVSHASTLIEYEGETRTLSAWADHLGIPYDTLSRRFTRGKKGFDLFAHVRPVTKKAERESRGAVSDLPIQRGNHTYTLKEWSIKLGIPYNVLYARYKTGKRGFDLLAPMRTASNKPAVKQYETPVRDYDPT